MSDLSCFCCLPILEAFFLLSLQEKTVKAPTSIMIRCLDPSSIDLLSLRGRLNICYNLLMSMIFSSLSQIYFLNIIQPNTYKQKSHRFPDGFLFSVIHKSLTTYYLPLTTLVYFTSSTTSASCTSSVLLFAFWSAAPSCCAPP